MSKELSPLEANIKLYKMVVSAGNEQDFDLVEAIKLLLKPHLKIMKED